MQVIIRSRIHAGPQQVKTSEGRYQNDLVQYLIYTVSSGRTCIGPWDVMQDVQQPSAMLLYYQHASVKDKRHPHVDEKSPGRFECTSLTRHVCIMHAIQVRRGGGVACRECYS
jgi:hypothetical protein